MIIEEQQNSEFGRVHVKTLVFITTFLPFYLYMPVHITHVCTYFVEIPIIFNKIGNYHFYMKENLLWILPCLNLIFFFLM